MRSTVHSMSSLLASLLVAVALAGCSSSPSSPDAPTDSGVPDTTTDVGTDSADAQDSAPADTAFNGLLSKTTLYSDFTSRTIAADAIAFEPAYALWTDGAKKRRWVQLPPGTKIDTSDMDNWKFPIGTRFWKEFATPDGKLLETRLIQRESENGYRFGAYVWRADASDAEYTEKGALDINGTDHDVPTLGQCQACHSAAPGRINGFQAIQLSKPAPGTNLDWLVAQKLLSDPPAAGAVLAIPGDAVAQAALGTLHANCGHCHNSNWELFSTTNQVLRLESGATKVEDTTIYKSTVWQKTGSFKAVPYRIVPGDSTQSAVSLRMSKRGDPAQMPPLGTKHVDDVGLAAVRAWIDSLPKTDPPGDAGVDAADAAGDAPSDASAD